MIENLELKQTPEGYVTNGPTKAPEATESPVPPGELARSIFADKYPELLLVDEFTTNGNTYIAYHSRADTQIYITGQVLNWELGWQLVTIDDRSHLERTFVFSQNEQEELPTWLKDQTKIEINSEVRRLDENE